MAKVPNEDQLAIGSDYDHPASDRLFAIAKARFGISYLTELFYTDDSVSECQLAELRRDYPELITAVRAHLDQQTRRR